MNDLMKIRDVSARYDVSARTLRYYEDMGLIASVRNADYAYRLYDEQQLIRLEQILILRKLNISIKDIKRIFDTNSASIVLDVLNSKVGDVDSEIALLHELRDIILRFIGRIKAADFANADDVKLLYAEAREIEQCIGNVDYDGNPSDVNRLLDVTEQLKKSPEVRIIQLPRCRMATSGYFRDFSEAEAFDKWFSAYDKPRNKLCFMPLDFLWFEEDGRGMWYYAVGDDVTEADTGGFSIVDFEGGLYAAAMSVDGDGSEQVYNGIRRWVERSDGFDLDERPGHRTMCHMVISDNIRKGLGYNQLDIFVPIKLKDASDQEG